MKTKFYDHAREVFIIPESKYCIIYRPDVYTFADGMIFKGVVGWYKFGKCHRVEGPAVIWGNRGIRITNPTRI